MVVNKLSSQLQMALRYENLLTPETKALFIRDRDLGIWEVIVQYVNTLETLKKNLNLEVYDLGQGFAQVMMRKVMIGNLSDDPNIIFISLPQPMTYTAIDLAEVCAEETSLPTGNYQITGKGFLLAIVDSGIDYTHPDFIKDDGTTRIKSIWDQGGDGEPPEGFSDGTVYTEEQINEALKAPNQAQSLTIVPAIDELGHGTALAGVAGGNGRASVGRRNKGMAPECDFLIVKVKNMNGTSGPRDIDIMQGVYFAIQEAKKMQKPLVILLGSGYNTGSHNGTDVLALYINAIYRTWICNIVVGIGNEGNRGSHYSGTVSAGETTEVELVMEGELSSYACSIWKPISDEVEVVVQSPNGEETDVLSLLTPNRAYLFDQTAVLVNFSDPIVNISQQQIFILLQGQNGQTINNGLWRIRIRGQRILQGQLNIWGSIIRDTGNNTRFLSPDPNITLNCPADAQGLTTVGAYNGNTMQIALFSSRGYTLDGRIKPELVAPGVGVTVPSINEGERYTTMSGTSIAAAFVAGAYLLMQTYGIVQLGNTGAYGDTLEVYLIRNTRSPEVNGPYPNNIWGYGMLCLEEALNNMREVANQTY